MPPVHQLAPRQSRRTRFMLYGSIIISSIHIHIHIHIIHPATLSGIETLIPNININSIEKLHSCSKLSFPIRTLYKISNLVVARVDKRRRDNSPQPVLRQRGSSQVHEGLLERETSRAWPLRRCFSVTVKPICCCDKMQAEGTQAPVLG